jgi:hypothetical protein
LRVADDGPRVGEEVEFSLPLSTEGAGDGSRLALKLARLLTAFFFVTLVEEVMLDGIDIRPFLFEEDLEELALRLLANGMVG